MNWGINTPNPSVRAVPSVEDCVRLNDLTALSSKLVKSLANTVILSKAPNEDECSWLKLISLYVAVAWVNLPVAGLVPAAYSNPALDD